MPTLSAPESDVWLVGTCPRRRERFLVVLRAPGCECAILLNLRLQDAVDALGYSSFSPWYGTPFSGTDSRKIQRHLGEVRECGP